MTTKLLIILFCLFSAGATAQEKFAPCAFRVMTFNLWHGGDAVKLPRETTIRGQLDAIRRAEADVVGLQEQISNQSDNTSRARVLADSLGWHCHVLGGRAVISRFPFRAIPSTSGKAAQAVILRLDNGKQVAFGVVHLMYTPYEPYDIADKKLKTPAEAERSARQTRLHEIQDMLRDLADVRREGIPAIVVGDFNEPSCLDWTAKAIADRNDPLLPFPVNWPATAALLDAGFEDAYRNAHPDVASRPGYTWTSFPGLWREPEVLDRIDLIYHTKQLRTTNAHIVGEEADDVDIRISPWPSDHRAVVAEVVY